MAEGGRYEIQDGKRVLVERTREPEPKQMEAEPATVNMTRVKPEPDESDDQQE